MNLNFDNAIRQILNDDYGGHNPIQDPLCFDYLKTHRNDIVKFLESLNLDSTYKPEALLTIDVPKSNFTIRPMGRPNLQDWIIYQATINYILPKVIKNMSKRSFSKQKFQSPKRRIDPWLKFDEKSREFYDLGYRFAIETDISSYFENIDLEELHKKLLNQQFSESNYEDVINFLFNNLLYPWSSGRVKNFGLPQGSSASSFLGDFYLDSIDSEMEINNGYIRFMDDIRIFCKTEIEAKKSLIKLIKALRNYKLNINAKKTRILKGKEIPDKLFDPKKPILDGIQAAFESKNPDKIKSIVPILVNDVFLGGFSEEDKFGERHINFATYRLALSEKNGFDFDRKKVKAHIVSNFISKPHHSKYFSDLLRYLPEKEETIDFLFKFLKSRDNIYEWQELHVLRTILIIAASLNRRQVSFALKRLKDKNTHWALRLMYCLLIGKFTPNRDRDNLIDLFEDGENQEFKKGVMIAVQELGIRARSSLYSKGKDRVFPHTFVNFIKGLQNPVYFKAYEVASFEFIKQVKTRNY